MNSVFSNATFVLAAAALSISAMAGPTPVPSVRPGTPIGKTPVSEGRWQGFEASEGFYVFFDVKNREVTNLRFTLRDEVTCKYDDGKLLHFPLVQSKAGSASVMNLMPIPADGKLRTQLLTSDSGHWYKIGVAIFLNGKTGTVQMAGTSVGDPAGSPLPPLDTCRFDTLKATVSQVGVAKEPIPQPCGYPWSPPDCSSSSPLTGPPVPAPGGH